MILTKVNKKLYKIEFNYHVSTVRYALADNIGVVCDTVNNESGTDKVIELRDAAYAIDGQTKDRTLYKVDLRYPDGLRPSSAYIFASNFSEVESVAKQCTRIDREGVFINGHIVHELPPVAILAIERCALAVTHL